MRSKTIILLVLALGCGLVASIGISQVLQRNQEQGPAEETAPIWIAMTDIKNGDALSPQNLKLENWPKEKIPPGALSKLEQIDGKRTRATIYSGEVVLEKKLRGIGTSASVQVPPGFRLYTVQGDALNSAGGLLQPGDRVDLLVYVNKSFGTVETGTKTILQDLKVFAVNDMVTAPDEKSSESITARTVTLLMTPSEAEKATLAGEIGKIKLVVRNPDDKVEVSPDGTLLSNLFNIEKTDRDIENMDKDPIRKAKAPGLAAVLSQVQQAASQTTMTQPAVSEEQSFSMQIIKGTEQTQQEFKKKFDDDTRWENGSVASVPTNEPAVDTSPAKDQPKSADKGREATKKNDGDKSGDDKNHGASGSGSHA